MSLRCFRRWWYSSQDPPEPAGLDVEPSTHYLVPRPRHDDPYVHDVTPHTFLPLLHLALHPSLGIRHRDLFDLFQIRRGQCIADQLKVDVEEQRGDAFGTCNLRGVLSRLLAEQGGESGGDGRGAEG